MPATNTLGYRVRLTDLRHMRDGRRVSVTIPRGDSDGPLDCALAWLTARGAECLSVGDCDERSFAVHIPAGTTLESLATGGVIEPTVIPPGEFVSFRVCRRGVMDVVAKSYAVARTLLDGKSGSIWGVRKDGTKRLL